MKTHKDGIQRVSGLVTLEVWGGWSSQRAHGSSKHPLTHPALCIASIWLSLSKILL